MRGFEVITPGILSTVQDIGRKGYANIGVTQAGALDEFAYNWANKLLDNPYGTNALEIVLGGLKLRAKGTTYFVVCGAKVKVSINSKAIQTYKTYKVSDGDIVDIGFASSGVRAYLAVKNGFEIKPQYDSCSVSIKEGIGGRALKPKDFLPFSAQKMLDSRKLCDAYQADYTSPLTLRVVAAYQWDMFDEKEREKFFASEYRVTQENNRMGFRLSGEKIHAQCDGIISEPIAYGSIQIPSHGEPIILLKERQTIGGYPKIGSVIPIDCFKLAQMKQDAVIKFKLVSIDEARLSCKQFYQFFQSKDKGIKNVT